MIEEELKENVKLKAEIQNLEGNIPTYTEVRCLVPVADKYLIPVEMKEFMESFDISEFEERLSIALKED